MKLLFAHDHIFYKYNNQYYSTGGLSKEMLERYTSVFDEVVVISRQRKISTYNDKLTLASTEKVKFIEIPNFKTLKNIYKIFDAKRIINNEIKNCDSVIARLPSSIGSLAVDSAKRNKKPYLVEVVACPWDALWNHSIKGKIVAPFAYFRMKKLVKDADYLVYVTKDFLQKRYPTFGKNINCSNVALKEFDNSVLAKRLERINNGFSKNKVIIGTTAAVDVKHKGQQYIIQALGKLKEHGIENYEYQLVGGGNQSFLKSIAEKYNVSEKVKFLGVMPHNEVFEWLDSIDIYVQPSRQEGLPRALIEAMSRGVPAFGARTAGIPELLEDGFVFSNTRRNIDEICGILKCFDKEVMKEQTKRNYEESKKYDKEIIESRRKRFFMEFKSYNYIARLVNKNNVY